ncbi:MAG: tetratricopeptide repeat protein [Planctomycetes bacterium]|nr:tetratricopeptide repeat protein [Planctomycetota bacterium]
MTPYQRVAVLDFKAPPDSPQIGAKAANLMIAQLLTSGNYQLIERSQVDQILKEHQITGVDPKDTASIQKIGTLLKAQAIIVGTVGTYNVEEYKGTAAVTRVLGEYSASIKTGESQQVSITEDGRMVPAPRGRGVGQDKYPKQPQMKETSRTTTTGTTSETTEQINARQVLVDQIQVAKRATVSVDFRMIDTTTGRILQARDQGDTAYYLASSPEQALYLPANDQILNTLLRNIVNYLSQWASPRAMGMARGLHIGKKDQVVELGVTYAQRGRWEEAVNQWQTALKINQYNPYAHNNLGVAYELQGRFEDAIKEYQEALRVMPNEGLFMDNLSRARRDQKDRESK